MADINQYSSYQVSRYLNRPILTTHDIPGQWSDQECIQAAVLIPMVRQDDAWHLLYIRRAHSDQDRHSGQVAFAGGKKEPEDDDLENTALREAQEEIGIRPEDVSILGALNHHHSITRFRITPVVGEIPWPYPLMLDAQEVARTFTIPLEWLADENNHRIEYRKLDDHQSIPVVYFDEFDGELLWGATARMTLSLVRALKREVTSPKS